MYLCGIITPYYSQNLNIMTETPQVLLISIDTLSVHLAKGLTLGWTACKISPAV